MQNINDLLKRYRKLQQKWLFDFGIENEDVEKYRVLIRGEYALELLLEFGESPKKMLYKPCKELSNLIEKKKSNDTGGIV
jgi:hypothetical protein